MLVLLLLLLLLALLLFRRVLLLGMLPLVLALVVLVLQPSLMATLRGNESGPGTAAVRPGTGSTRGMK